MLRSRDEVVDVCAQGRWSTTMINTQGFREALSTEEECLSKKDVVIVEDFRCSTVCSISTEGKSTQRDNVRLGYLTHSGLINEILAENSAS